MASAVWALHPGRIKAMSPSYADCVALAEGSPGAVKGNIMVSASIASGAGAATLRKASSSYNIGRLYPGRLEAGRLVSGDGHVEIHFADPAADLAGDVTIEFEVRMEAYVTNEHGHGGYLFHLGKFRLDCAYSAAVALAGPGFHHLSVFIGSAGGHSVHLDGALLMPNDPRFYSNKGLAGEWDGHLTGEVTPRGVLLIGAHAVHNPRPTVYDRIDGQIRNVRVRTATLTILGAPAAGAFGAPGDSRRFDGGAWGVSGPANQIKRFVDPSTVTKYDLLNPEFQGWLTKQVRYIDYVRRQLMIACAVPALTMYLILLGVATRGGTTTAAASRASLIMTGAACTLFSRVRSSSSARFKRRAKRAETCAQHPLVTCSY
jgi:hypothetical protein